jgi:PKD repeat protein
VARCAVRARLVAGRIGAAVGGAGRGRTKLLLVRMVLVLATMSLAVGVGAASVGAQAADPPITTPPPAGAAPPPAAAIIDSVDPLTPCSGWSLQSAYGGWWPTQATWWEYTCAAEGAREPSGSTRTDYYSWDGPHAQSVYYGQRYLWYDMMSYDGPCMNWWDQAANQWYGPYGCSLITPSTSAPTASFTVTCAGLRCGLDASASADGDGTIQRYSWDFGDGSGTSSNATTADHTYGQAGSYTVQLTVTDDRGETATATKAVAVAGSNAAPTASFTVGCAGLDCRLDASASADSDGTIQQYSWDFGDGGRGSGVAAQHAYAQPGSYLVTLTVTDNAGATATNASAVTLIGLVARGDKLKGVQQVELAWNGSDAASFDVYRNGGRIATVAGSGYTDNLGKTGTGGSTYQVCQATTSICSNQATVNF